MQTFLRLPCYLLFLLLCQCPKAVVQSTTPEEISSIRQAPHNPSKEIEGLAASVNHIMLPGVCHCNQTIEDKDGDCIPDALERGGNGLAIQNHSSDPSLWDTDGDGVGDGCEDRNHNGIWDTGEMDPSNQDTDGDSLTDGLEDKNKNGIADPGETSALLADSDFDGIPDGLEDKNHNGRVDAWQDLNHNGCFDAGDMPGESDPLNQDSDGDGIPDGFEDKNKNGLYDAGTSLRETIAWHADTDCDGIIDGREDLNGNGQLDVEETDPLNQDSDGDGIPDGIEDSNHDGIWDPLLETNPRWLDTDGDGLADGLEDKNHNGIVDGFQNKHGNGCYSIGDPNNETDPRLKDSDGDGLNDNVEDVNQNGLCDAVQISDPLYPGKRIWRFVETCGFIADSDCDGIPDGIEDKNKNGQVDLGETDPLNADSDGDGLTDGCPQQASLGCEDKNNNGQVDLGETDPLRMDSDGDGLSDGCEIYFQKSPQATGSSNPLSIDSDGDGITDGDEDSNHNCRLDSGETDPRHADTPPQTASALYAKWYSCSTQSIANVSFLSSSYAPWDFQLALEIKQSQKGPCLNNNCPSGQVCQNNRCLLQATYDAQAFFEQYNNQHYFLGYVFQSPASIDINPVTQEVVNDDIYGFVQVGNDQRQIDVVLDEIVAAIRQDSSISSIKLSTAVPASASHDANLSGNTLTIFFAQRSLSVTLSTATSSLLFRNYLLQSILNKDQPLLPDLPTTDAVYGSIPSCNSTASFCYNNYQLKIGATQRYNDSKQEVLSWFLVLTLTPDKTQINNPPTYASLYLSDSLMRMSELTGGAALSHEAASLQHRCSHMQENQAKADLLFVIDDSRSMQQLIVRLQKAAQNAKDVLTSNAAILDYRVAMTTTNPSRTARTLCPNFCEPTCYAQNGASLVTVGACLSCADQALGCIKPCPLSCLQNNQSLSCDTTRTLCSCQSCSAEDSLGHWDCCPLATAQSSCVDPQYLQLAVTADANQFALPGGAGSFYAEDTSYLDCDSSSNNGQIYFLNPCGGSRDPTNGAYAKHTEISAFYGSNLSDKKLSANGQMLHADPCASCTVLPLDLYNDTAAAHIPCASDSYPCCDRLVDSCSDGATVLASQICDLIRAMGGVPQYNSSSGQSTDGARRHSSTEHGILAARRFLDNFLPALPYDWQKGVDGIYDANRHARLTCSKYTTGCTPCDPRFDSNCQIVPVVTVFLSDEEDFLFKDDCAPLQGGAPAAQTQNDADHLALPKNCIYVDGDPTTIDTCTQSYCQNFLTALPDGYDPSWTAATTDAYYTLHWRTTQANQCSANDLTTSCIEDSCPSYNSAEACAAASSLCVWQNALCLHACKAITAVAAQNSQDVENQQKSCEAQSLCQWRADQVRLSDASKACVPRYPLNDCQACKRFLRLEESAFLSKEFTGAVVVDGNLPGLATLGPVYAIVRNANQPGQGGFTGLETEDLCAGGPLTWGLGDGQAFHDLASLSGGRTQDICASDYLSFMQTITQDMAVMSIPYPLDEQTIAASIEVHLARIEDGQHLLINVPRSQILGFFYDELHHSLGFKSNAIDGLCAQDAGCKADGIIDSSELSYAQHANTLPRAGDTIYVSYSLWQPPPCGAGCGEGNACIRQMCLDNSNNLSCLQDGDCAIGYACDNHQCQQQCTLGNFIDVCVPAPRCAACQSIEKNSLLCQDISNTCLCQDNNQPSCLLNNQQKPLLAHGCPIGYSCSSDCQCQAIPGCSAAFSLNGSVEQCQAALNCCEKWRQEADLCTQQTTTSACSQQSGCYFNQTTQTCLYSYQTCCPEGSTSSCGRSVDVSGSYMYCRAATCSCPLPPNDCTSLGLQCDIEAGCLCTANSP